MEHSNETSTCTIASCACGTKQRAQQMNMPAALLWTSAFLLAALTIIQAARLPLNAAFAGAANQGGQGMSGKRAA